MTLDKEDCHNIHTFRNISGNYNASSQIYVCMTKSTEAITHFKLFFVQNAKNPLSTAIGHLNAKAGGGVEGQSWKQSIDPSWSFSQFKASVGSTLGSVDVIQIVSLIKEVDTATLN